jgi:hypothetical protein
MDLERKLATHVGKDADLVAIESQLPVVSMATLKVCIDDVMTKMECPTQVTALDLKKRVILYLSLHRLGLLFLQEQEVRHGMEMAMLRYNHRRDLQAHRDELAVYTDTIRDMCDEVERQRHEGDGGDDPLEMRERARLLELGRSLDARQLKLMRASHELEVESYQAQMDRMRKVMADGIQHYAELLYKQQTQLFLLVYKYFHAAGGMDPVTLKRLWKFVFQSSRTDRREEVFMATLPQWTEVNKWVPPSEEGESGETAGDAAAEGTTPGES